MARAYETPYDTMNRRNREREAVEDAQREDARKIGKVKPGAPYYQPREDDSVTRAQIRAQAQGEYMKSQAGDRYQQDEGFLAPAARTLKNVMAGKRGAQAMEGIHGDAAMMEGARKAGQEAVERQEAAELKRESRGMKNGGMTASARADGCAQRGKTRGKMV